MAEIPRALGGVTAHLAVKGGARKAIDFYTKAFGAQEVFAAPSDDGERILHAHLAINGGVLLLNDDFPEFRGGTAAEIGSALTLHLQVDDADAWFKRAVDAGASVAMPIGDQFWGDRYGQVKDPFGFTWAIGSPIKK